MRKTEMERKLELLAPAGGMKELRAAVQAGADAVYLGGRLFNARMNAGNFDDEEMRGAVAYAHLRGVKIYVTMNTLLYDDELGEALRYAAFLYDAGVDALIIQDLGLGHLIRKHIPGFELHLSTQGTVYNASGARMALSMGYSRVVCAREMTLDEIRKMSAVCETEVFVHGAICMCYSGQCQLSRSIGGRSGNRGQCAQPCRLLYEDEKGEKGYWLSPKDLCLIDRMGDLIDAGVRSFKIEGRMKSPEYVAVVTSIYRKYIDAYIKEGKYTVSKEDRRALMQIFSRGSFTEGYIDGQPANFLSGDLPKHQGILIGHVLGRGAHDLVRVMLTENLQMGDGVEIRGGRVGERRPAGNVVTYIEKLDGEAIRRGNGSYGKGRRGSAGKAKKDAAGGEFVIGDIRGDVRPGDMVYRISSKHQLDDAKELAEGDLRKIPVRMKFFAVPGKNAQLKVSVLPEEKMEKKDSVETGEETRLKESAMTEKKVQQGVGLYNKNETVWVTLESAQPVEQASNRPTVESFVRDKLAKIGGSVYSAEKIEVKLIGDCYLPASVINQLRRAALEELDEKRLDMKREAVRLPEDLEYISLNEAMGGELAGENVDEKVLRDITELRSRDNATTEGNGSGGILADGESAGAECKVFPEITKGDLDIEVEEGIAAGEYDGCEIVVNNLGWIAELKQRGATVYGGKGLNVTNGAAAEALAGAGIRIIELSKEMEEKPDRLMITEYDLPQRILKGRQGVVMTIKKESGKTVIQG